MQIPNTTRLPYNLGSPRPGLGVAISIAELPGSALSARTFHPLGSLAADPGCFDDYWGCQVCGSTQKRKIGRGLVGSMFPAPHEGSGTSARYRDRGYGVPLPEGPNGVLLITMQPSESAWVW